MADAHLPDEPFPDDDSVDKAIVDLARYFGIGTDIIHAACKGLEPPNWVSPNNFSALKESVRSHNRCANLASELAQEMKKISQNERSNLISNGCVTAEQIEHLAHNLYSSKGYGEKFIRENPRAGGRRLDALVVAKIVLRVFRILEKRITISHVSGIPNSEYAKAVEYALGSFNIKADWRRAAEAALDEYEVRRGKYRDAKAKQLSR